MNRNLKFAIAAAIASLGVTGQAHALTRIDTLHQRQPVPVCLRRPSRPTRAATNTAIFDLGLASAFDTTANQSFDLSATTGWTSYVSDHANPANIHWGVFGSPTAPVGSAPAC